MVAPVNNKRDCNFCLRLTHLSALNSAWLVGLHSNIDRQTYGQGLDKNSDNSWKDLDFKQATGHVFLFRQTL